MPALQPDGARLQGYLDTFSAADVGGTAGGGVSRPAASDADRAARDRFRQVAEGLGLVVTVDDIGNLYARRPGRDASAAPVVIGSHLDTVVPGGRFDGIAGVCVALETVAALNDAGVETLRPVVVVSWTGEEGARFSPAMVGSGVVTGVYGIEFARSRTDADGLALGSELDRIGYTGSAADRLDGFFAALELHIEQGPVLEQQDLDVGVVSGIEPVRWCTVTVTGPGGHAGGPGPAGRRDTSVAAARMVVAARDASLVRLDFRTTVGRITASPGSNNVIPHTVTFNLDVRSATDELVDAHVASLRELFGRIAEEEGVSADLTPHWSMRGASFSAPLRSLLGSIAEARGLRWTELPGPIGHDALYLARTGPTAMVFTRTRQGRSHCEDEFSPAESVLKGAAVLADATLVLADATSLDGIPAVPGGDGRRLAG